MKKLLIVVDFQKDFVDGSLGFEKALTIENNIVDKIIEYRENNNDIIFTYDTHFDNYLSTQEGTNLPITHCIKGTEGWELYGKVKEMKKDTDKCFEKNTFGSLELANYLKDKDYGIIELVGLVSNICVVSNAILAKSALPEAEIIVDAKCTASFDDTMNEKVLDVLSNGLQVKVINR
jgi:nicotinamidase-related amidase